jgi:Flp pilus assembly protein TadG
VIQFVVVVPMLMLLLLASVQLALALYVRSAVTSAAADGARVAATSGGSAAVAQRRVRTALDGTLAAGVVQSVTVRAVRRRGVDTVEVQVRARLPLFGLLGPASLVVYGHALSEG